VYWLVYISRYHVFSKLHFADIDDCKNITCNHNGACVDLVDNYHCDCKAGYTGGQCETGVYRSPMITIFPL